MIKKFFLIAFFVSLSTALSARPLNLVFILADDLGYGDLGCYGNTVHRTPNIDRMAEEGARFTNYYVTSSVCTPTRYAMLTGRHPARERMFEVLWPPSEGGMSPQEITMAEWLQEHGYQTGLAGKWHLGHHTPDMLPPNQGFDDWYGMPYPNDMGPFHVQAKRIKGEWPPMPMYRGLEIVEAPVNVDLLTQQYTAEAVRFIAENHHHPFFLFLSHAMPHTLLGASQGFKGKSGNGLYGDAVEELDWSVGEILRVLRAFELEEQTLVIFTSDNGAALSQGAPNEDPRWRAAGSNAPLRGGKGGVFEGGMREPGIFWWPGSIKAGLEIHTPAIITDTIPTFAELANLPGLPTAVDGESIAPLLKGKKPAAERTLFFGSGDARTARRGDWKYLVNSEMSWKRNAPDDPQLYNLASDPGETINLIKKYPQIARELRKAIDDFQAVADADWHSRH